MEATPASARSRSFFSAPTEQKKKYLPLLATGEKLAAYCLSEPQAGSDAQNSRTRAVLSPDGRSWILNGQKMWITNGGFADVYIVFAKVDGEKFSCFIVERGFPGFSAGAEEKKMGLKGSSTTAIFFENCQVPKENLLHEIGRGHIVAFNILNAGRFSLGAYCTGGAKGTLETASKYAKERFAFGKPIGDFGLIREKLAEMAIRIFAVESMIYRSAGLMDRAIAAAGDGADKSQQSMKVFEEYAIESSISKVYGSELLDFVVDEAVQIFGGYGFHEDYPVARAYRDSRVNRIFEGTNEINRMLIIQMLMKRATSGALPLMQAGAKLREEILAGPSFEESPSGAWAEEERILAGVKKGFSARGRRGAGKISRSPGRPAGSRRRAFRYRDGMLRDRVFAAARAEGGSRARAGIVAIGDGGRGARVPARCRRSRRDRRAQGACRRARRRHAADAACGAAAIS